MILISFGSYVQTVSISASCTRAAAVAGDARVWGPWRLEGRVVDGEGERDSVRLDSLLIMSARARGGDQIKVQSALMELYRQRPAPGYRRMGRGLGGDGRARTR